MNIHAASRLGDDLSAEPHRWTAETDDYEAGMAEVVGAIFFWLDAAPRPDRTGLDTLKVWSKEVSAHRPLCHHRRMTDCSQITCGDGQVTGLLRFVAARKDEHIDDPPADGEATLDVADLAKQLLGEAEEICQPGVPCALPKLNLLALALVAMLHDQHPDFDTAWRTKVDL